MARFNAAHDLPRWECGQRESIPCDHTLLLDDVTACTIWSGDKAPGSDKITVRMLKSCWNEIGEHVRENFQVCLEMSHFPTDFRAKEALLLPKPGRDPATAKRWRPISLLSCLGKSLERLVAKQMAWLAIEHRAVPSSSMASYLCVRRWILSSVLYMIQKRQCGTVRSWPWQP